jgi:hypothetical protein
MEQKSKKEWVKSKIGKNDKSQKFEVFPDKTDDILSSLF